MQTGRLFRWRPLSVKYLWLAAMISIFLCDPVLAGKVYKCVAEDGSIVYQQKPCCEEEQEKEIAYPDFLNGKDGRESVHAESIKELKKKSDIQYLEIKIKESARRIDSLKKAKQTKVDYWRAVMMYATEHVQTIKVEKIINSVTDDYDRKIDNEQEKKRSLEKRLAELK